MVTIKDISGAGGSPIELPGHDLGMLKTLLGQFRNESPRVIEITWKPTCYLQLGVGGEWCFVQYVVGAPWQAHVALQRDNSIDCPASVYFNAGGTPSEIPSTFLIRAEDAVRCALACIEQEGCADGWDWELV